MTPAPDTRFTPDAADSFRAAIAEAGGIELFAVGRLDGCRVAEVEVHCRGNRGAVPALLSRPRPGEVVIHNHPSGVLEASEADMTLAGAFGEDGVGMVIVDNAVRRALWVTEPLVRRLEPVGEDEVAAFFEERLPVAIPGYEPRGGQVEMARAVARTLNHEKGPVVAVLEAGTGTGKSLAYLVPAVLWALRNGAKVAVATYTHTLQGQLAASDLPILRRAGLDFAFAVIKGRSNYICRRRLAEAIAEGERATELQAIAEWAATAGEGTRTDLGFPVDDEVWDLVASDHDQTLRARCPRFGDCFYYRARRAAAAAHVIVANHHLLLADLALKQQGSPEGILPRFDRVIVDEAHHLEDAATSLFQEQVTATGIRRAIGRLLPRRERPGALGRIEAFHAAPMGPLPQDEQERAWRVVGDLQRDLPEIHEDAREWMEQIAADALDPGDRALRLTAATAREERWHLLVEPTIGEAARRLGAAARGLGELEDLLRALPPEAKAERPQPLFDLARAHRRLEEMAALCASFSPADENAPAVRWIEEARGARATASLSVAPIEVGPILRQRLFEGMHACVATSATLTVGGEFVHFLGRVGLGDPPAGTDAARDAARATALPVSTGVFPSPFDYGRQAILALPRDLPDPDHPTAEEAAAAFIESAVRVCGGGVFVLCTSYRQLDGLHARVSRALGDALPLFRQGQMGRDRLLASYRVAGNGVLFGTDSFWEGVSVAGEALRMVVIPRLPFRVPTEPVQQARFERIEARGQDPFRALSLPQAVLRLRQGSGRLVRTRTDRGAVVLLDRRVIDRWYGRVFLASLPPMARVTGPARSVLERLAAFFREAKAPPGSPLDTTARPP